MRLKNIYLLFPLIILCTGCISSGSALPSTPDFVTAVLPTPQIPQATSTFTLTTPVVTDETASPVPAATVEGITITEINVRAQPSTASAALGTLNIFTKIQISGQDSTGSWYQIAYADSSGWVRAEYVQVDAGNEIPVVAAEARSASGISALVIQKINVRNGPGTNFESLGALNPNDVVHIIGKDSSDAWAQIEFANAPDGKGWASIKFLKIDNVDALPIIGATQQATATPLSAQAIESFPIAMPDGDSMQAPLAKIIFSPTDTRTLQLNGDVSAPEGDTEDWLQFTSDSHLVKIKILCSGNGLHMELWSDAARMDDFLLACGSEKLITVTPGKDYFLRVSEPGTKEFHYTNYIASVESVH